MPIIPTDTEAKGYARAQKDMLMNAIKCEVPYKYIREMASGNKESELESKKEDIPAAVDLDITDELATMALRTLQQYIHNIHNDCGKSICAKEDNGRCWIGGCPDEPENDRIGQEGEPDELRKE